MSDGEEDIEFYPDIPDSIDDEDLIYHRTLVHFVAENEPLYNKRKKKYCGKNYDKAAAWEQVGAAMIPPLSGDQASKLFYSIRQRMGKELRKKALHEAGQSGQADLGPFCSLWPLWEDCQFLIPYIQPRKTSSSYKMSTCTSTVSAPPKQQKNPMALHRSCGAAAAAAASQSSAPSRALWATPIDIPGDPQPGTSTSNADDRKAAVIAAMRGAGGAAKKSIPPADSFSVKKKKKDDELMEAVLEQGKALTAVATTFGEALKSSATPHQNPISTSSMTTEPVLGAIRLALENVPEAARLGCMLEIIQLIQSKFGA